MSSKAGKSSLLLPGRWGKVKKGVHTASIYDQDGDEHRELRHALHIIGIYRHLVTVVSFPAVEYSRETETVEGHAEEFKTAMLNAVLGSYRRQLYDDPAGEGLRLPTSGSGDY